MSEPAPTPKDPATLPDELAVLCQGGRAKIIAVLARPGVERLALTTAVLQTLTSPGVVVATRDGADAYREFFRSWNPTRSGRWTVLEGGNSEGGIRAVARALARARDLIDDPNREESLSALWLPAHILEAFGLLPADGAGLVVIDSWDGLLDEYLSEVSPTADPWPSPHQLEKILVRTLRQYAQALVVVLVDSSSQSRLAELADGVVEVVARGDYGTLAGSILVTRRSEGPHPAQSLRFHLEGGTIRWHLNR
ncbi:MAG: hypothetical protein WA691_04925 [Thermoplasmata archaeon]